MSNLEVFEMTANGAGWVSLSAVANREALEVEVGLASVGLEKVQQLCPVCSASMSGGIYCSPECRTIDKKSRR